MSPSTVGALPMYDATIRGFGLLIAFLLPGFLVIFGYSLLVPALSDWLLTTSAAQGPSVGGFLFSTLASLMVGLLISAVRCVTVDPFLYYVTCLPKPQQKNESLGEADKLKGFEAAIENHYRYFQCYSHSWIASIVVVTGIIYIHPEWNLCYVVIATLILSVVLIWVSREELRSYNDRIRAITQ